MSILNNLIPKHILETNLKRLEKFFNLEKEYSPIDEMVDYYIDDQKVDHKTFSHDPWFDDNVPYPYDGVVENPDESDEIEEEKTMHEKMYDMATARYNPFSIGGSENCHSDIDCPTGGSEAAWKVPPRPEEEIYDQFNDPYGGY